MITEDLLVVTLAAQMNLEDSLKCLQEPALDDVYKLLDYVMAVGPIPAHHLTELRRDVFDRIARWLEKLEVAARTNNWRSATTISEALLALPPECGIWSILSPYTPECACCVA